MNSITLYIKGIGITLVSILITHHCNAQSVKSKWLDSSEMGLSDPDEEPTWKSCNQDTYEQRKLCSDSNVIRFNSNNLVYPRKARKKNTQGKVVVQYIIEADGSFSNLRLVQDIGHGCGKAALDCVKKMHALGPWQPGILNGSPIRTVMTQPFTFQLTD